MSLLHARKRSIAIAILLAALILIPLGASAFSVQKLNVKPQDDFVLEPGKVEVALDPGQTFTKDIMVTNRTTRPMLFKIEVEDFIGVSNEQNPIQLLGSEKSPYSFKDNVVPEVSEFSLKPGERASIPVTVSVPTNAAPGGYFSSVLVSNELEKEIQASSTTSLPQTRIISRIGVLYFVRVNGPTLENGHLEDFRISPTQMIYQKAPLTFEVLFKNEGNVYLVPYGTIAVKNIFGSIITSIPLNAYFSLPNSTRYRRLEWKEPLLIGRYTATLNLNRGYGDLVDTKSISFWVIPWKILVGAFLIIFLILSAFYFVYTRFEFRRKR